MKQAQLKKLREAAKILLKDQIDMNKPIGITVKDFRKRLENKPDYLIITTIHVPTEEEWAKESSPKEGCSVTYFDPTYEQKQRPNA